MTKVINENPVDIQLLKLDNIYASLVTLVAVQLRKEEGETKKSFDPYIDEAHKLIMEAKQRIHEITLPDQHDYF
ncbi:MAG: hypothetical protein ACYC56_04225 [Candidatus Aquicultor sp.]